MQTRRVWMPAILATRLDGPLGEDSIETLVPEPIVEGIDLCLMIEGHEGVTWPQWQALARACERHSIPVLFRSDHYLDSLHPERGSLDAWGTLNALAAVTSTLRLGTMVSPGDVPPSL